MEFTIEGNKYQVRDSKELMNVAKVIGHHFFDGSAMKGFGSKLETRIFETPEGVYFVTSEKFGHGEPRRWTIRLFNLEGSIRTVDEFQKFNNRNQAYRYVEKNLLKKGNTK